MSTLGDVLAALKNIVLLQERLEGVQRDIGKIAGDVGGLDRYIRDVDKRVVRIETMIEMTRGGGGGAPRIEA